MSRFSFKSPSPLDGFIAGPDQSVENPLGVGGMDLHGWIIKFEVWRKQGPSRR